MKSTKRHPTRLKTLGLSLLAIGICVVLISAFVGIMARKNERAAEANFPPIGQFVNVDGRQVHALVTGTGPDLILIHGASGNIRDWTFDFVDQLKDRYRVIVMDRPGLGYTDRADPALSGAWSTDAETPQQQARMLKAAADQLGVKNPIVLGYSFGGAVAMAWALEFPDHPSGMVILSGATEPWPGPLDLFYRVNGSLIGGLITTPLIAAFAREPRINASINSIFEPAEPPKGYKEYIGGALVTRRASMRANTRQVLGLRPHLVEMSKQYPGITLPTEILHGDADTIVPASIHARVLDTQLPNSRLTILNGVGHMPHHTNPADVISAIDRLRQTP